MRESLVPRGLLYTCDELFFTGTAVEIAPICSVDRITVGEGRPGEITRRLMAEFQRIITGDVDDPLARRLLKEKYASSGEDLEDWARVSTPVAVTLTGVA